MNDLYKKQEITLRDRTMLKITGIGDVSSFDEFGITESMSESGAFVLREDKTYKTSM